VQFRKWATTVIKEYTIKAYVMDDERIKSGGFILTEQYFEEQGYSYQTWFSKLEYAVKDRMSSRTLVWGNERELAFICFFHAYILVNVVILK